MNSLWTEHRDGDILTATYRNPPMNYFTEAAITELDALVDSWADSDARVIVLAGGLEGKFITHFSAEEILAGVENPAGFIEHGPVRNVRINAMHQKLNELRQPVIAALNGDAMGYGFELALACDLRVGEDKDHRYGLCEVSLGIIPGAGGTQRLARLVGMGAALDYVMRARVFHPTDALARGLITDCGEDALALAMSIAADLIAKPAHAVAAAKKSLQLGSELPLPYALNVETDVSFRVRLTESARERVAAYVAIPFAERRDWLEATPGTNS